MRKLTDNSADNPSDNPDNNPYVSRDWQLARGKTLALGPVARIMGILNVTPDSFSDGGNFSDVSSAIDHTARMIEEGADIIDVGGQSTRPGAGAVSLAEERDRIMPVIEAIAERFDILISADTYRSATAKLALDAGAHIINDVRGFQHDAKLVALVAKYKAGACIMHNSRGRKVHPDVMKDQFEFFKKSLKIARDAGITRDQLVLDPGFGFGKKEEINLQLLGSLNDLHKLGYQLLVGTSRKRFTGYILGENDTLPNRDGVTAATSVIARMAGCSIFRVHDVRINRIALDTTDAVIARSLRP